MGKKQPSISIQKVVKVRPIDLSIVKMFANGNTVYEVSQALKRSDRTIENRMARLKRSLGARNTTHLVYIMIQQGVLKP